MTVVLGVLFPFQVRRRALLRPVAVLDVLAPAVGGLLFRRRLPLLRTARVGAAVIVRGYVA